MVKSVNYKVQEVTQETGESPAVFLSRVTESFKNTRTEMLSPQKGGRYRPCILLSSPLLMSGEIYKILRLGLKPCCQPW